MKPKLALMAIVASILFVEMPVTATQAVAASARCAAGCDKWCAKNFAMKNSAACSQQCQLKHCN
jgi:hypothetical protein